MLPQGCQGRHARQARDRVVLLQDVGHRRAQEKVELQGSSFKDPPALRGVAGIHLNEALRGIQRQQPRGSGALDAGHEGNGAIESHGHIHLIFKDVQVVESVRFLKLAQMQGGRMLCQPHQRHALGKGYVKAAACGTGPAVHELIEGFFPQEPGIQVGRIQWRPHRPWRLCGAAVPWQLVVQEVPGIEGLQQKPITKDLQLKGLVSQQNSTSSALRGECCATLHRCGHNLIRLQGPRGLHHAAAHHGAPARARLVLQGEADHSAALLGPKELQLQGERFQLGTFPIAVDDLGRDLMALNQHF
mmetsp:Transcript_32007/g.69046  ORF Transcript_32007/g.69046 Transcript_32007/m.69046 type:complete len:302 (-) Transcript_32007:180-1085(-)